MRMAAADMNEYGNMFNVSGSGGSPGAANLVSYSPNDPPRKRKNSAKMKNKPIRHASNRHTGTLFFTLTRGRVAMPFYRDALSRHERWDVINYLRSAFGKKQPEPKALE